MDSAAMLQLEQVKQEFKEFKEQQDAKNAQQDEKNAQLDAKLAELQSMPGKCDSRRAQLLHTQAEQTQAPQSADFDAIASYGLVGAYLRGRLPYQNTVGLFLLTFSVAYFVGRYIQNKWYELGV
ncbi:hypothetical protein HXX76_012949 [Chlamydomonas incerta]|uniref:Uncharacterized protein n=1 Tax=Chlamydomonas incerta TaxID=51695 RepID=A0A835SU33_CHLIN|nr:hypothetical protein HXX76_012949 [Chlamydomonas incerta]|eukprot:KAG2426635.1 hypothetical protein HXX76_012949 [Chlamydomonas incerta]